MSQDGKTAVKRPQVGDNYPLRGHCLVAFPDGSVVTASRSLKLTMPGKYRVIPNDSKARWGGSFTVATPSK